MPDYSINLPVNVFGQEKIAQLQEAIKQTGSQTKISGTDFRTWQAAVETAANAGYTFNTALNKVRTTLKDAGVNVDAFTDRLKANVREQEQLANAAERSAARASRAAEQAAERQARAAERASAAQERAIARAEAAAERAASREAARVARFGTVSENVVGRIGGRIIGSEIGGSLGIPGAGFIGSQTVQSLGISGGTALGLGAAAAGVYGAYEIGRRVTDITKWAQEQRNLSRELGISSGQMATFSMVAEQTGTHIEAAVKSVSGMAGELEKGGSRAREINTALHELGLSQTTAFKPAVEATQDILDALGKIPDAAKASQAAVDLIGDSGRQLASMVRDFPELRDKLKVDDETINRIARFRDVLSDMESSAKLGMLDAVSYVLSGVLPDRSGQRKDSRALPSMSPLRIPSGGLITIGGGVPDSGISQLSPAELRSRNLDISKSVAASSGTPEDIYNAEVSSINEDKAKLQKDFIQGLTVTPEGYQQQMGVLGRRKSTAEAKKREAERLITQQREFGELPPIAEQDLEQLAGERHMLPKRFNLLEGTSAYQERSGAVMDALNQLGSAATEQEREKNWASFLKTLAEEAKKREAAEHKENLEKIRDISADVRSGNISSHGDLTLGEARAGSSAAVLQGATTFGRMFMTPGQTSRLDYQLQMAAIQGTAIPQGISLGQQIGTYQNALSKMQAIPGEESDRQQEVLGAELDRAKLDLKALEISTTTKSIEAINKFNESIVKAAESMRSEFASGFSGVILGAQRGHGGALGALRGFGEKIEGTLLHNVGEKVWDGGVGNIAHRIGSSLPDWLTKGTVFGKLNDRIDPALLENSSVTKDNSQAVRDLTGVIQGIGGGGTSSSGGTGAGTIPSVPTGDSGSGGGAAGTASDIGNMAAVAASLGAATGGSTGQQLTAMASALSKLDSVFKGTKYAGNIPKILSGSLNTKEEIGAVAGTVALGIGAFQGIRTIAKGGVGNAFSGTAMTLASIAPFFGPVAGPIIGAAAAVSGLVGSFIPDPHTVRAQQMERRAFTQQYLAPQAMNLSMSGSGGYSDVDFMGNVRSSHFSPYPISSNAYLDVPRRTVVPGHTLSGFGGYQNVTGAKTPTIVNYHNWNITNMDAKSFIDNGHKILDAVNHTLSTSYHPVVRTLHGVLGNH